MNPSIPRRPTNDPQSRQEARRHLSTAKDLLLSRRTEANVERCWELVTKALSLDPCARGGNALLVAVAALRATHLLFRLPSGGINPYTVFGLRPMYAGYRDPALIESYYRQAFDLLNPCHPSDPLSPVFAEATRIVADAWAVLSDPGRKAALDSNFVAAPPSPPSPPPPPPRSQGRGKRAKKSVKWYL